MHRLSESRLSNATTEEPSSDQKENRPEGKKSSKQYIRMLLGQLKACKEQIAQQGVNEGLHLQQLEDLTEQNSALRAVLRQSLPYRGLVGDLDETARPRHKENEVDRVRMEYEARLVEQETVHAKTIEEYRTKIKDLLDMLKTERDKAHKATLVAKRAIEDSQNRALFQYSSDGLKHKLFSSTPDC